MAVKLLAIPQYRSALVHGFILSIGSKTDSTVRLMALHSNGNNNKNLGNCSNEPLATRSLPLQPTSLLSAMD